MAALPASEAPLPEFGAPPVVEVALGIQFRPLFTLRPIELAPLRERWRNRYPLVQEQPPQPPTLEGALGGAQVQFVVGPPLQLWFIDEAQAELVQLQHDRFTLNWRQTTNHAQYPRYTYVRGVFWERLTDLRSFVTEAGSGSIEVTQVEVTYLNAVDPDNGHLGILEHVLRAWRSPVEHHLGAPEQARVALVFDVPEVGQPPVRLYVGADPGQRPDGRPVVFLTLTVRGAPAGQDPESALRFMDEAHDHIVRSFAELTPETMHQRWKRRQ